MNSWSKSGLYAARGKSARKRPSGLRINTDSIACGAYVRAWMEKPGALRARGAAALRASGAIADVGAGCARVAGRRWERNDFVCARSRSAFCDRVKVSRDVEVS